MRSFVTVITPAANADLTTLERVKAELSIDEADTEQDPILESRISEASAAIADYLRRVVAQEQVVETFRFDHETPEFLTLQRWPVGQIASVTIDDVPVVSSEYELYPESGILYRLTPNGYRYVWIAFKNVVVTYTGGYVLPDESGRNLPRVIEAATVKLVCDMHISAGRDSRIKSENIPGVIQQELWVGSMGENGLLPPDVAALLDPYRLAY